MNTDFEAFKKDITWFIEPTDNVIFLNETTNFALSSKFKTTFPILTKLIEKARVLNLTVNNQPYLLFSFTNKENVSCGWLNKVEENATTNLNLIDEHKLLLQEIGGIQEAYNQPDPSLSNNQNFMFIESNCTLGIGDWNEYYEELCEEEGLTPINSSNFISFVEEANGNVTLYDLASKKVLLFANDHCFDNVEFLEDQPEYTFHKINNVTTFTDYVELLATEWVNELP